MPRGGRRAGAPGKAYGNRTDMNAPKVVPFRSTGYGTAAAGVAAQEAVPMNAAPASLAPQPAPPERTGPGPGELGGLLDPTARPDEPLTAGVPFGPGPGPSGIRADPDQQAIDRLRVLYRQTGSPALGYLLEAWED